MGVLNEGVSVVARVESIEKWIPGGVEQYREWCPNPTSCSDGTLVRVGFMHPGDCDHWIDHYIAPYVPDQEREHLLDHVAVIDQFRGSVSRCTWLRYVLFNDGVSCAYLEGTEPRNTRVPDGWGPAQSLAMMRWEEDREFHGALHSETRGGDQVKAGPWKHYRAFTPAGQEGTPPLEQLVADAGFVYTITPPTSDNERQA